LDSEFLDPPASGPVLVAGARWVTWELGALRKPPVTVGLGGVVIGAIGAGACSTYTAFRETAFV